MDKVHEVVRYDKAFRNIWSVAMSDADSRDFIAEMARELRKWIQKIWPRPRWFKSTRSDAQNNCVEIAFLGSSEVALRDTKDKGQGPVLVFTPTEWDAFIGGAMDGEFNRP